jgi:hypothetical protein
MAWLCNASEAQVVLALLGDATSWALALAFQATDRFKLYELGWRMVRCAVSEDDIFLAAAALAASPHPERAQFLVAGYFPAMEPVEQEGKLARARERLDRLGRIFVTTIDDPPLKQTQELPVYTGWEIAA